MSVHSPMILCLRADLTVCNYQGFFNASLERHKTELNETRESIEWAFKMKLWNFSDKVGKSFKM